MSWGGKKRLGIIFDATLVFDSKLDMPLILALVAEAAYPPTGWWEMPVTTGNAQMVYNHLGQAMARVVAKRIKGLNDTIIAQVNTLLDWLSTFLYRTLGQVVTACQLVYIENGCVEGGGFLRGYLFSGGCLKEFSTPEEMAGQEGQAIFLQAM